MTDFPDTTPSTPLSDLRAATQHILRSALARLRRRTRNTSAHGIAANTTPSSADAAIHLHLRMCGARQPPRF